MKPDDVAIHMYTMGTGDCFVLKFRKDGEDIFKMMIDCGVWSLKKTEIQKYVRTLKEDIDNHVDILVVTHEHKDHVYGFQAAEELFTDGSFSAQEVWMGWTEDDSSEEVQRWKADYGQKKRALAMAAMAMKKRIAGPNFKNQFKGTRGGSALYGLRKNYASNLEELADLHIDNPASLAATGDGHIAARFGARKYIGGMKGMEVVKQDIPKNSISFLSPGDIMEELPGLDGIRIYVLGPPALYSQVREEHGSEGESYGHNKDLDESDLFLNALEAQRPGTRHLKQPFHQSYSDTSQKKGAAWSLYNKPGEAWRKIDDDWLFSAGQFALRMNSLTNNLSVALAIEFTETGKVLLFPGDAELGSWKSWQGLDWDSRVPGVTTQELLNRTVFYKVAHHCSHNGTARSVGLDQMTSPDLVAMATLDYSSISTGWMSTMPNRTILRDLLEKTKGRLIMMNTNELFYDFEEQIPLKDKIEESREQLSTREAEEFWECLDETIEHYIEYVVRF